MINNNRIEKFMKQMQRVIVVSIYLLKIGEESFRIL